MRLVRDLDSVGLCPNGCVVTLGNFDGLHLGHQALCAKTLGVAQSMALESAVVSFDPMPQEFFAADNPPARLQRTSEKVSAFASSGFDLLWLMRFNRRVAKMSAKDFVGQVLARGLNARAVVVGEDFRYGSGRAGNLDKLRSQGSELGFEVHCVAAVLVDGQRVSSTAIRAALAEERFADAARMLGRPYRMSGRVMYGRRLGRKLGFPTINLSIGRLRSPLQGVFAVRVFGVGDGPVPGVASIGTRPTVVANGDVILEVFLLDYSGDLYGRRLEVEFAVRLRSELRFDNLDRLREQMQIDTEQARAYLAEGATP